MCIRIRILTESTTFYKRAVVQVLSRNSQTVDMVADPRHLAQFYAWNPTSHNFALNLSGRSWREKHADQSPVASQDPLAKTRRADFITAHPWGNHLSPWNLLTTRSIRLGICIISVFEGVLETVLFASEKVMVDGEKYGPITYTQASRVEINFLARNVRESLPSSFVTRMDLRWTPIPSCGDGQYSQLVN